MPIAHFDRNSPNFWGVVSKVATLQNLWVPDPAKVRRSRFRSAEIDVFRPNSWTNTLIWPITTIAYRTLINRDHKAKGGNYRYICSRKSTGNRVVARDRPDAQRVPLSWSIQLRHAVSRSMDRERWGWSNSTDNAEWSLELRTALSAGQPNRTCFGWRLRLGPGQSSVAALCK